MPVYAAPLRDMRFVLHEVLNLADELQALPAHAGTDAQTVDAVLEEAGRFAAEVAFPLNMSGDAQGCAFDRDHRSVTTPAGFKQAYARYVDAGWPSLSCDPRYGGQGLPFVVNQCLYEMLNSANQAWTMYPGLSHGAYEALSAHGTEQQKATYLPRLVSGEWTGTMCLTEPHCGTDLGLLRTRAEPQADGSYRITGNKIFISAGEHDLAANIVHLVLARLPDAPPGSRGISLFVVPKFLPDADGAPGARNPIHCVGLEHKMGIHANATAQIAIEGATGSLVGEPHKGLQAMFVMMNAARLGVGNQSLGLTEVALQNALAYAKQRTQGRAAGAAKAAPAGGPQADRPQADPIVVHPDVRKMLLTAKAYAEGGRALQLFCALLLDTAHGHPDPARRAEADALVALLTPIVKAFLTDNGHIATNACMQVLGGHGYIKEWGLEQFARDNRINQTYEGTNTVQALDLLGRKVLADGGAALALLRAQVAQWADGERAHPAMAEFLDPLAGLGAELAELAERIGADSGHDPYAVGAAATDYLRIAGHYVFGYLFARMARVSLRALDGGSADAFYTAKLQTARFYFARLFPETGTLLRTARAGSRSLMDTDAALA